MSPPIALTIAGTDPTGGAGIQADLKTFAALGVYGASAMTALVAQNTQGVRAIHDVPPDFIRAQIDSVFDDLTVDAVKIGMLSKPDVIRTVAAALDARGARPVVLDPVMVAASGDPLLDEDAVADIRDVLIPRASLITPNLAEAAKLLDCEVAETSEAMREQAEALLKFGSDAVLLKGGHGSGADAADVLVTRKGGEPRWFVAERIDTRNTHGTGCTLSSAIAAGLARGLPLADAVALAKDYLTGALAAADTIVVGKGRGPVHHFHALWQKTQA
ncbi:bifunctional hydroxymethylpyrimidine kinase/phosphomethylpyrimidine kinase [Amorphus orientalis]|uniref:hydroxymethylpyrimidine kinase n=1 Tax=Amorphus orientalis TaxID=649198 RepID=A0AAE3VTG3_9HYPH|nr:bifunctional hydroxymethylpyrimidine kinase/phosphomethylpyrimidine kinase [Amorphus orientalis]MDQ0317515.1 hydroxymethylpyrimidine/phosphomethylpyrimidine kinase [Amorphus orientalis]